jgi:hypothetical protein
MGEITLLKRYRPQRYPSQYEIAGAGLDHPFQSFEVFDQRWSDAMFDLGDLEVDIALKRQWRIGRANGDCSGYSTRASANTSRPDFILVPLWTTSSMVGAS